MNLRFFFNSPRYSEDTDLDVLGGSVATLENIDLAASLDSEVRSRAMESLISFDYADYQGQVLDYLEPEARARFTGTERWRELAEAVFGLLYH